MYHFQITCYSFCWNPELKLVFSYAEVLLSLSLGSAKEARFDCTIIHWIKASFPVSFVSWWSSVSVVWHSITSNCALLGMACCGLFSSSVAAKCRCRRDLDSPWSWLVCFSATFILVPTLGISLNFGVLFPVLMDYFQESRERVGKFSEVLYSWSSTYNSTYFDEFAFNIKLNREN